jgi:hypothetical protein
MEAKEDKDYILILNKPGSFTCERLVQLYKRIVVNKNLDIDIFMNGKCTNLY